MIEWGVGKQFQLCHNRNKFNVKLIAPWISKNASRNRNQIPSIDSVQNSGVRVLAVEQVSNVLFTQIIIDFLDPAIGFLY